MYATTMLVFHWFFVSASGLDAQLPEDNVLLNVQLTILFSNVYWITDDVLFIPKYLLLS